MPALLIQNGNNSTILLLLVSKLPQNEITLASDPLYRSSIQPLIPVQVQQLFLTALTTFFSDDKDEMDKFDKIEVEEDENTLMPYMKSGMKKSLSIPTMKTINPLIYTKTGNDGLINSTENDSLIHSTSNALDDLYATGDDATVPGQEAPRENRLEKLSSDINTFQLLQVDHKATCSKTIAACDKLLVVHHPDKNSHPDNKENANETFHIIF